MASVIVGALTQLLERLCGTPVEADDQVVEYVASQVDASSAEDVEDCIQDWDVLLCGACPAFGDVDEARRVASLAEAVYAMLKVRVSAGRTACIVHGMRRVAAGSFVPT